MIFAQDIGSLNLLANLLMLAGVVLAIYIALQLRRMVGRLEMVLAPKTGVEGYLAMCAQVVESDPDGTCVVDDSGEIVLVNEGMENISGYHRSELIGQMVEMLVPDTMRGGHARHRDSFTMRPSSRPMRGLLLKHKRGTELPVDIRLNRYIDATGGFTIAKVRVP